MNKIICTGMVVRKNPVIPAAAIPRLESSLRIDFRRRLGTWLRVGAVVICGSSVLHAEGGGVHPLPGADESTPSRSHYFSWIDNTNEGSTEHQTLVNLEFFNWHHDGYGMDLDIYALDAGAIDTPGGYGSIDSERFKKQFPNGFGPIAGKAKSFGCRLGVWLGPDGFGDTAKITLPSQLREAETPGEASVLKDSFSGTKRWQTFKVNRITINLPHSIRR